MKSTNKAFTLIELLAVILILGIIALIAIPAVSGIVKDAKDSAAKTSAENYVNAAETAVMKKNLTTPFNPTTCEVSKTTLSCEGYAPLNVDVKGDLPESGTITFKNNSVEDYSLVYNNKTVTKDGVDTSSSKKYKVYANGTPVYFDVTTGKKCTNYTESQSATGIKSGCMKFYAFNDTEDSKTVNLLLDHNTSNNTLWNENKGWAYDKEKGPITLLGHLHTDTDNWKGTEIPNPVTYNYVNKNGRKYTSEGEIRNLGYSYNIDYSGYKARLISADEVAQITGNDIQNNWNSSTGKYFYFHGNGSGPNDTCKEGNTIDCPYGWLYDRTFWYCKKQGCSNDSTGVNTESYWTSSALSTDSLGAWVVFYYGLITNADVEKYEYKGLRPVITVLKSKLS